MTTYRTTLTRCTEKNGIDTVRELDIKVINEPATFYRRNGDPGDPGCFDIEPIQLRIDGRLVDMDDYRELVDDMIANEWIPEPIEYE